MQKEIDPSFLKKDEKVDELDLADILGLSGTAPDGLKPIRDEITAESFDEIFQ